MKMQVKSSENAMKYIESLYKMAVSGIPGHSFSVKRLAQKYFDKYSSREEACEAMIRHQVSQCVLHTELPEIAISAIMPPIFIFTVGRLFYMQMNMVACIAYMAGYDPYDELTMTFVLASIMNVPITEISGHRYIKGISQKDIKKINEITAYRYGIKFIEKGKADLGRNVPLVGHMVGLGMDYLETKEIAERSYDLFFGK